MSISHIHISGYVTFWDYGKMYSPKIIWCLSDCLKIIDIINLWIFKFYDNFVKLFYIVRIQDVVLKTGLRRWTIGKSGERGSGISVLPARHNDDDDDFYMMFMKFIYGRHYFYKILCRKFLENHTLNILQIYLSNILLKGCIRHPLSSMSHLIYSQYIIITGFNRW